MTEQGPIVTPSVIIWRYVASILYFKHFSFPLIKVLLRLINEISSSYIKKVNSFFREEIDASEESATIRKISDKKSFLLCG